MYSLTLSETWGCQGVSQRNAQTFYFLKHLIPFIRQWQWGVRQKMGVRRLWNATKVADWNRTGYGGAPLHKNHGTLWTLKHSCNSRKSGVWSALEITFSFDYVTAWLGHIRASASVEMVYLICWCVGNFFDKGVQHLEFLLYFYSHAHGQACFQLLQMKKHFLKHKGMVCVLFYV